MHATAAPPSVEEQISQQSKLWEQLIERNAEMEMEMAKMKVST